MKAAGVVGGALLWAALTCCASSCSGTEASSTSTVADTTPLSGPGPSQSETKRPAPVVDQAATPPGYLPVAYGDAQISVPSTWALVAGGAEGCGTANGAVVLGEGEWCPPSMNMSRPETTIATLQMSQEAAAGQGPPVVINGIATYAPGVEALFVIPALHSTLLFHGTPPTQVLQSLTYSPRSVVLSGGTPPPVPRSWHWLSFGGLRFAVPANWHVGRVSHAPACGSDIVLSVPGVTLATAPPLPISCPAPLSDFRPVPQVSGIEVDDFDDRGVSDTGLACADPMQINSLHICIDKSPAYGVLVAQVENSGRRMLTIRIGLNGSGINARTVLYSIGGPK